MPDSVPAIAGPPRLFAAGLVLALLLALPACGGGGTEPVAGTPPTDLTYSDPDVVYRVDESPTPNQPAVSGGTPTDYSVTPALPAGVLLDTSTGVISGAPSAPAAPLDYLVTAANADGETTGTVRIEVRWPVAKSLYQLTSFDDADLRHFLLRTHWGIRQANYDALVQAGLPAYIDAMLVYEPLGSTDHETTADTFLLRENDPPGQEGMFPYLTQLTQWWVVLMILNPNSFQEVLAFFWHDHLATSSEVLDGGGRYWMKNHINLFREKGAGNLRTLFIDMARDWAMLRWLDGLSSTDNNPNENFAREFFELFLLGVDNGYEQGDILEAARAFTGYRQVTLDPDTGLRGVVFDPNRHDEDAKTIFGVTIPAQSATDDYEAVVDLTMAQRDVSGWIALNLLKYFCTDDPAPELVAQFAQEIEDEGWELAPALKTLFLSEAFFAPSARKSLIKDPVDFGIGFMNATGLIMTPREFELRSEALGQIPTRPETVNGWPGGQLWLSAQGMVDRANLVRSSIVARELQEDLGIDVADLLPPGTPTAGEVVDAFALLLGVELTPTQRTECVTYLDTERQSNGTIVPDPFDPTDPSHVDDRVRGLLYILAQHPTYMLR